VYIYIFAFFHCASKQTSTRTHSSSCSKIYHLKSSKEKSGEGKNDFIICDEMKKENKIKSLSSQSKETQARQQQRAKIVTFIYGFISPFIFV
jgi:hypothetical protein